MSLYYRTLTIPFTNILKVDFLTKTDPGNIINLTTDIVTIANVIASLVHNIQINTSASDYSVQVYKASVLFQTFSSLSGNTTNIITSSTGTFEYYVIGNIGMSFTTQLNISFIGGPPPQSVAATGFNNTGQTIT